MSRFCPTLCLQMEAGVSTGDTNIRNVISVDRYLHTDEESDFNIKAFYFKLL